MPPTTYYFLNLKYKLFKEGKLFGARRDQENHSSRVSVFSFGLENEMV